jgi:hypothetical protein
MVLDQSVDVSSASKSKAPAFAAFCGKSKKSAGRKRGSDRRSAPPPREHRHEQHDHENEKQELRNDDPARNCEKKKNEQKHQQHLLPPWWGIVVAICEPATLWKDDPRIRAIPNEKSPNNGAPNRATGAFAPADSCSLKSRLGDSV